MNHLAERYQRQHILEGFGLEAQEKLSNARILVIGAGGLGCPILQYLAVAGIGTLGIADNDRVAAHNLNRQILYGPEDIGTLKVEAAATKIGSLNESVKTICYPERWTQQLSILHFPQYDIIVDATDNFATRYLINDGCVLLHKPLVFGAVSRYEGQVAVFNVEKDNDSVNYRDLFAAPPQDEEVLSCSEAGVLGVLPGIIGVMQATEVIKLITGIGTPLVNQMRIYNALSQEMYAVQLSKSSHSAATIPPNMEAYLEMKYEFLCASSSVQEITVNDFLSGQSNFLLVDVRAENELPRITHLDHIVCSLSELVTILPELKDRDIVFVCQSGVRSKKAAALFQQANQKVYSLQGGVLELFNN